MLKLKNIFAMYVNAARSRLCYVGMTGRAIMDFNQLEYFVAVAKLGHVTRASEELQLSQSALSRSISKLEEELGFALFNRCGKNIALNENGQIFLNHALRALQEINIGKKIITDALSPEVGSISLAFLRSLGVSIVPDLLSTFRRRYPKIQINLSENSSAYILEQLRAGEIDLCFCPPIPNDTLDWRFLFTEELFLAVPASHRLATCASVQLQDIAYEPFVTLKKGYGLRILAERFFQDSGFEPLITFEGEEIMTLAGLVEAQLGVALIPYMPGLKQLKIVLLPISKPKCIRTIGIAWNKKHYLSPAAKNFINFVREHFHEKSPSNIPDACR